jgi:Holliday junction resolvasome RuvABC DNA-binding subunit
VARQIYVRQRKSRQLLDAEPNGPKGAPTPFDRAAHGLVHLGFRVTEARRALGEVIQHPAPGESLTAESLLRSALERLT